MKARVIGSLGMLVHLVFWPRPAPAEDCRNFDFFTVDTVRRVAIVEAFCLRADDDFGPARFRSVRVVRGFSPDSFTAAQRFWRPLDRPEFASGRAYLLGLERPDSMPYYAVVGRFRAVECPQWASRILARLDRGPLTDSLVRDSCIRSAGRSWDAKGRKSAALRPAPRPWSDIERDSAIARLHDAFRAWDPTGRTHLSDGTVAYELHRDSTEFPNAWLSLLIPLEEHPDSVVRRLAFSLWDTSRVLPVRRVALSLTSRDSSAEAHRWLLQLGPTGLPSLDRTIALRLLESRDTSDEARSAAWQLVLRSSPGDWSERYAFIVLRRDTTDRVRAERWGRVAAGETKPFNPWGDLWIDNAPPRWDNWPAALGWTSAEAWRAFNDPSPRLRIVATRVLCLRGDSDAVARAIRRVRTRRGPGGLKLEPDEVASILEALPASHRPEALRFDCGLARRRNAAGSAAVGAITYYDTPQARRALLGRARSAAGREPDEDARRAATVVARWAHREDLPEFHRLALVANEEVALAALGAIGRIEGPEGLARWAERRYHGPPPRDSWSRLVSIEDEVRRTRR